MPAKKWLALINAMSAAQAFESLLSREEKEKLRLHLRKLSVLNPVLGLFYLAVDWLLILAIIFLTEHFFHPLIYILAVVLIATRQNALLVIGHEGSHYRLLNQRKWNTWITNFFCAYPLFFQMEIYRYHHLAHHQHNNTELDPDIRYRKGLSDFQFPMPLKKFIGIFVFEFFGVITIANLKRSLKYNANTEVKTAIAADLRNAKYMRWSFYAGVAILLSLLGGWKIFLLYWLVPLAWIFPLIVRLKNISEHCGLSAESELQGSRDVTCSWLEGWFIAPHYIRLHLVHHLYPSVPFYHLSKMHRLLRSFPAYEAKAHRNSTYLLPYQGAVWRELSF